MPLKIHMNFHEKKNLEAYKVSCQQKSSLGVKLEGIFLFFGWVRDQPHGLMHGRYAFCY
jgi:hypothetical protein